MFLEVKHISKQIGMDEVLKILQFLWKRGRYTVFKGKMDAENQC